MAFSERLLIAALAWGALAFGAVYPWGYGPLAAACAVVGVYGIVLTRAWRDHRPRRLGIALAIVATAISVQLITFPYEVIQRLSPAVDRYYRQYEVLYHPASVHALSLSTSSTMVALLLFAAFALLLVGLMSSLRQMSLEWVVTQLMGLGVALTIVAVIQKPFIADDHQFLYGFWKPQQTGNPFGPFINRNHFAGWMVMAVPVVAGYSCALLAMARRPTVSGTAAYLRWLMTVDASRFLLVSCCTLLMVMALVLTQSRSGIASFVIAVMVFGYFAVRYYRSRRARALVMGYLSVMLFGAIVWAGTDTAISRFVNARADVPGRLTAWWDTARIIADFPVFGTGLGTYAQAMLVYQTEQRPVMFAQAHNDYLQILAEGGALVIVPVLGVIALILTGIRRRLVPGVDDPMTYWIRAGAIAGLAGIAAQSAVEFSLQLPGNRVLFVLLLAIALHRPRSEASRPPRAARRRSSSRDAYRV